MSIETNKLFENIKNLRYLITEGIGDNDIIKHIQNHEYVYIFYAGDVDKDGRVVNKGVRTIAPYVLGVSKDGNKVIRAWQFNKKNSFTFTNRPTRQDSENHDFWYDNSGGGGIVPGWRMFRLDKIEKMYPIGKKFNNQDGTVMIPPEYNEGADKGMTSIISYVSSKTEPDFIPKEVQPQPTGQKINKWDKFSRGNKNNQKIVADDVIKLRDIASRVFKKNRENFLVVINNNNEFELIDVKDKGKVPPLAIVGTLPNLYDTLVKSNITTNDAFFKDSSNKLKSEFSKTNNDNAENQSIVKEQNLPSIPYKIKHFFKQ